jgi:hypothetical protein
VPGTDGTCGIVGGTDRFGVVDVMGGGFGTVGTDGTDGKETCA